MHSLVQVWCCDNHVFDLQSSMYPSCRQITLASERVQPLVSAIVPHRPPRHTSTRPSLSVLPPTSLTAPVVQAPPIE